MERCTPSCCLDLLVRNCTCTVRRVAFDLLLVFILTRSSWSSASPGLLLLLLLQLSQPAFSDLVSPP